MLEAPEYEFRLFAPVRQAVSTADYAAGLHIASLVKDGGTLQIGIGSIGDAIAYALVLRDGPDSDRAADRTRVEASQGLVGKQTLIGRAGGTGAFRSGCE